MTNTTPSTMTAQLLLLPSTDAAPEVSVAEEPAPVADTDVAPVSSVAEPLLVRLEEVLPEPLLLLLPPNPLNIAPPSPVDSAPTVPVPVSATVLLPPPLPSTTTVFPCASVVKTTTSPVSPASAPVNVFVPALNVCPSTT